MEYNLVYFKRKGVMIYVNRNDSYIVSYLLDKTYKDTFYIERNSMNGLITLLNNVILIITMINLLFLKIINILNI